MFTFIMLYLGTPEKLRALYPKSNQLSDEGRKKMLLYRRVTPTHAWVSRICNSQRSYFYMSNEVNCSIKLV